MNRCKHENVDHLKRGDLLLDARGECVGVARCEQFRCIDCAAWLPLGDANDSSPEVQIEIRAAEIAATGEPFWHVDATGSEVREGCGWNAHACRFADTWCSGDRDCLAGYLASAIVTHDGGTP